MKGLSGWDWWLLFEERYTFFMRWPENVSIKLQLQQN
jgi:hypothetical protein